MYTYTAVVRLVHDGDTVELDVDLGFHTWVTQAWDRIGWISARELSMPGGPEAAEYARSLLPVGLGVYVRSVKIDADPADDMSFDRYVMVVTLPDGRDFGQAMIAAGYAVTWDGKSKPTPYPPWPRP
jgi:endonuclease YncB( thermonuclease family)